MIIKYGMWMVILWLPIEAAERHFSHHSRNLSDTALIISRYSVQQRSAAAVVSTQPLSLQYPSPSLEIAPSELTPLVVRPVEPKERWWHKKNLLPCAVWAHDVACFQASKGGTHKRNGRVAYCATTLGCMALATADIIAWYWCGFSPDACCDILTFSGIVAVPPVLAGCCSCTCNKYPWQYGQEDVDSCLKSEL